MRADIANVRFAEADDEPDLMEVARAVHDEFGLRDAHGALLPFSEGAAGALIQAAIEPERADTIAWIGVLGKQGALEGSVCLLRGRHPLANTAYLSEFWNWVAPSHRYSGHRGTLVAFSKTFARALGLPLISGVMAAGDAAAQERFYARAGGERLGTIWAFHGDLGAAQ